MLFGKRNTISDDTVKLPRRTFQPERGAPAAYALIIFILVVVVCAGFSLIMAVAR